MFLPEGGLFVAGGIVPGGGGGVFGGGCVPEGNKMKAVIFHC